MYNLIYIYLSTNNLYDCLISTKIRWMWRFRTSNTGANKVKTLNIVRVKVVGKVYCGYLIPVVLPCPYTYAYISFSMAHTTLSACL